MSLPMPEPLMLPPAPERDAALRAQMQRVETRFVELNIRIARLSRLLGVRVEDEADLQRLLEDHSADRLGSGATQRREVREWAELRALLKMRCDLLAEALQAFGLAATCTLAELAESDLQRLGFAPGSDGFAMLARLQRMVAQAR